MQYLIGQSTWGAPIVWQREQDGYSWLGSKLRDPELVPPEQCVNWDVYQFALWLQQHCRVFDYVYTMGGIGHSTGWYKVDEVREWCIYHKGWAGRDNLNFLSIFAHADADANTITQRPNTLWREDIKWRLHGF